MAPRIPPLRTEFLKITYDLEGRIAGMVMSPEWQKYFAQSQQFQEAVGVALNLTDIQDALDTTRESLESTLETDVQAIIDAGAAIQFGADYQGNGRLEPTPWVMSSIIQGTSMSAKFPG